MQRLIKRNVSLFILLLTSNLLANDNNNFFFLTSIPKCGTNLLRRCVTLMFNEKLRFEAVDGHFILNEEHFHKLNKKANICLISHALGIDSNLNYIQKYNIPSLFILRDPRDQIVSRAFWIYKRPDRRPHLARLSMDELLLYLIEDGIAEYINHYIKQAQYQFFYSIQNLYKSYLEWQHIPQIYTTTFEKLVGIKGGGSTEEQKNEINNIANHLGLTLNKDEIESISNRLFGQSHTFDKGLIGRWKKYFKKQHIEAFQRIAGDLLITLGYEKDHSWTKKY